MRRAILYRVLLTTAVVFLMLFANFFVVNRAGRYAVEIDFYNKLLVAYDLKGHSGVEETLKNIRANRGGFKRESVVAAEFEKGFAQIADLRGYLKKNKDEKSKRIVFLFNLRRLSFLLVLLLIILKAVIVKFTRKH